MALLQFTATLISDTAPGGWTIVRVPGSATAFGTRRAVRVGGTIDGMPFRATLLPTGDGIHMLPIRAALRTAIGKSDGDTVDVSVLQRH